MDLVAKGHASSNPNHGKMEFAKQRKNRNSTSILVIRKQLFSRLVCTCFVMTIILRSNAGHAGAERGDGGTDESHGCERKKERSIDQSKKERKFQIPKMREILNAQKKM